MGSAVPARMMVVGRLPGGGGAERTGSRILAAAHRTATGRNMGQLNDIAMLIMDIVQHKSKN